MDSQKTQILEKLKPANNVLVTVSSNPSVDQLSAAIGLTLMLNHLGKHATAVFSGQIPSAIEFLEPEKTLERTTDSLRDFIIALDKTKADKLRYKVEDQMVKIFITPYRTSISDKDLEFSQGDFNVDVVMALGVNEQADLDQAIASHGRILHDATVVTVGREAGSLGSINWNDTAASSLCEMVTDIGLALKEDILDSQTATALLTGIVAETERFSNEKTSSETMQVSAKLLTAGANQQLVASQLQKQAEVTLAPVEQMPEQSDETTELPEPAEAEAASDGSLQINHTPDEAAEPEPAEEISEPQDQPVEQIHVDENGELKPAEEAPAEQPAEEPAEPEIKPASRMITEPPTMGGTLTGSDQVNVLEPPIDPLSAQQPHNPILNHSTTVDVPSEEESAPVEQPPADETAALAEEVSSVVETAMPAEQPAEPEPSAVAEPTPEPADSPAPADTLAGLEQAVDSPHADETATAAEPVTPDAGVEDLNAARDAVMDAVNSSTPQTLEPIQALNAQPFDLNLGPTPSVGGVDPNNISDEPAVQDAPATDSGINLPPGVVPIEPPSDTAADTTDDEPVVINPTDPATPPPPPVPPPMVPPLPMPPTDPSNNAL